jgi:SAM-dependent methyltransferase
MNLKVLLKSNVADKVLSPIRNELIGQVNAGSSLLDIGSGTGDLLFRCASKLSRGLGVDLNKEMIRYAEEKRRKEGVENIKFICGDIRSLEEEKYDIATSTLCLHEVGQEVACEILELMVNNSKKVLVADYTSAKGFFGKVGIEIDEMFSGHYGNYRKYKKSGEIPFYANRVGVDIRDTIQTEIDGISIWVMDGKECA